MFDRRLNGRAYDSFAAKARREFWERKRADSERDSQRERESDARLVADWQVRFHMARNAACESQKNFRGI